MRFQHVLEQVYFRPWFISGEGHAIIRRVISARIKSGKLRADDGEGDPCEGMGRPTMAIDADGISTVSVFGTLGNGLSPIQKSCGNTDYADIVADLAAAKKAGARAILLSVDSPGGMCEGCVETARAIATNGLPTAAATSSQMCSAAYMLAAGCNRIFATDSSSSGCIGTIMPWTDESAQWERDGLSFQPITSAGADLKSAGHGPSLSDDQREYLQGAADDYADQFISHIQSFRVLNDEAYRGGAYVGSRSQSYGITDEVGGEDAARKWLFGNIS